MSHRMHQRPRRAVALAVASVLAALCVLSAAGLVFADDKYWVVGGTGGNYYFVPVANSGHNVQFDIINGSEDNGTASITANGTRTTSGTVEVTGGNSNGVGHTGQLRVRARLDGTTACGQSAGFGVCAHCKNVTNTFSGIEGAAAIRVNISWESDNNNTAYLNKCYFRERVTYPDIIPDPFLWDPPNPTIKPTTDTAATNPPWVDAHGYPPGHDLCGQR